MKTTKKLISMFLSIVMMLNIVATITPFVASADDALTFEYDGYTVDYKITNSWGNRQYNNVTVSIKNTGAESIENWMLAYDFMGDATMQSGGKIFETEDGITYVKNTGDNLAGYGDSLNIDPDKSVNFSYSLTNPTGTPDSFILCQERVALVNGVDYEVTINPQYDYGNSFQGEIKIKNLTDKLIECWELTFSSSNFTLQNSWDRILVDHGDGKYTIKPVAGGIIRVNPNNTLTFGFQANKSSAVAFADLDFNVVGMTETAFSVEKYISHDSDGDGLPDFYERVLGTDTWNPDTDIDGLLDGYEVSTLGTNPVLPDTDDNGISDANEDFDGDGLTNIEEYNLTTDPNDPDTDGDGLVDGEEISVYGTDPLEPDTDDDEVNDGDEIKLGFDPLNPDTDGNGITDGNEHILQTVDKDVETVDGAISKISVEMDATNYLPSTLEIESVMGIDMMSSEIVGLIGEPFDFNTSSDFTSAKLSFKIEQNNLNEDVLFDNITIMWYDEENQMYVDCAEDESFTFISDSENSIISVITSHFSTYIAIDSKKWYDTWYDSFAKMKVTGASPGGNPVSENVNYNTIFVVDCSGSMASNDKDFPETMPIDVQLSMRSQEEANAWFAAHMTNNRKVALKNFINSMTSNNKAAIITFDNTAVIQQNLTSDKTLLLNSVNSVFNGGGTYYAPALDKALSVFVNANCLNDNTQSNRIIFLTDGAPQDSWSPAIINSVNSIKDKFIKIYTIGISASIDNMILNNMASMTGGIYYNPDTSKELPELIEDIPQVDYLADFDEDGLPDIVEQEGLKYNGQRFNTDWETPDTDDDKLEDGDEIIITVNLTDLTYLILGKEYISYEDYCRVYKYNSDPTLPDTDFDGMNDNDEITENRNNNNFTGNFVDSKYLKEYLTISFKVDYSQLFTNNVDKYNRILSTFSILLSHDIYTNENYPRYIKVDGLSSKVENQDSSLNMASLFGLNNIEDIVIYNPNAIYSEKSATGNNFEVNDDDTTEILIGHREVKTLNETREVIVIVVRGTNGTIEEWSSNFDVGASDGYYDDGTVKPTQEYGNTVGFSIPDWRNADNHKGFDVAANRALDKIDDYIKRHSLEGKNKSFLVTGHSRGAAIANLIAKDLIDNIDKSNDKVFGYTFAAPNNTISLDWNNKKYNSIFNIKNKDDMVPTLPLEDWGFYNYGIPKNEISIKDKYEKEWEKLTNINDYNSNGNLYKTLQEFSNLIDTQKPTEVRENLYKSSAYSHMIVENGYIEGQSIYSERMDKYCILKPISISIPSGYQDSIEVYQTPAFLMMDLAGIAASKDKGGQPNGALGYDVAFKYQKAKLEFIHSGWDNLERISHLGGMRDTHLQISYYLISTKLY